MKYMGSKRAMLQNGLGELICEQARSSRRIVDLFCGAGAISWYAAENSELPVLSVDLQSYGKILAGAITERDYPLATGPIFEEWLCKAENSRYKTVYWNAAYKLERSRMKINTVVGKARILCSSKSLTGPIWNAYGGHYFSPTQALTFDYLIKSLPRGEPHRTVAIAAVLHAAIKCAASPGHTAQPFQPTIGAKRFILESWNRDPIQICRKSLETLCPRYANVRGQAIVAPALHIAGTLCADDLVIVDPPYSEVQYSRFYHVLETIARGYCGNVSGIGRYPPINERPQSAFCNRSQSKIALQDLFTILSRTQATVILTFPSGECTNGLSGDYIKRIVRAHYKIREEIIKGQFSTLGGNNKHRTSRKSSSELLLLLEPKHKRK
jgi:adenine-specific DNA-methyltransferase